MAEAALLSTSAVAQVVELPPVVVVQGATLAIPPKKVERPTQSERAVQGTTVPAAGAIVESESSGGSSILGGESPATETIGSAVSVITGEELRRTQTRFVADALRGLPGVEVDRSGGTGNLTAVRIRGAETRHTLVVIDGIPANTPIDGAFDFSDLSTDNIERIEVIRGPQSGLYGSAALGGVINIVTNGGKGPFTSTVTAEGGSFRTGSTSVSASGGSDRAHGAISYQTSQTDGFNISPFGGEKDGSTLNTFSLRGGAQIAEGVTANVSARNARKFGDRDGFGGAAGALGTATDEPSRFNSNLWLLGANLRWDAFDGHFSQVVRADTNRTDRSDRDLGAFGPSFSKNESEVTRYGSLSTVRFETPSVLAAQHTITGLVEGTTENLTPSGDFGDGIKRSRDTTSLVGEYTGAFADRLFLTGSFRHDDTNTFGEFDTWHTAASFKLPNIPLRPHASVGTGVKFPALFDQFATIPGLFNPNPNLKPEESFGWDAGAEWTLFAGRGALDVTYFDQNLENKFQFLFPSVVNLAGTSTRQGVEVAARYQLTPSIGLSGSYTYLDARDPNNRREIRRAPNGFRADVNYAFDRGLGNLRLSAAYNGRTDDVAFRLPFFSRERVFLDDYLLLSMAASYEVKKGVDVFARVENALNQNYQEVYGYQTAGAAAYGGIRMTFGLDDTAIDTLK